MLRDHLELPMFAVNTDLATHGILFNSTLPKATLGYSAIAGPVFLAALQLFYV